MLVACSSESSISDDFVFGASVAGFQVEMGCPTIAAELCEDRNSDWYAFITSTVAQAKSTNYLKGDAPSLAPGHYELWKDDFALLSDLSLNGFRFSIEWSRIFPSSTVGITDHAELKKIANEEALAYYRAQLTDLNARGITPLVTLNHYTLPSWLHDGAGCNVNLDKCSPRGWLEDHAVDEIAKYAGFVAREFGDHIDYWVTLNEPLAVVLPGYLFPTETRSNPPSQIGRFNDGRTVMILMIKAHARMVDAVRANDRTDADNDGHANRSGIVYPVTPVRPKDPANPIDRISAKNIFYLLNEVFLNGVVKGELDENLDGMAVKQDDLVGRSDFIGLNFYTSATIEGDTESAAPDFSPLLTFNPFSLEQGEPDPEGLYEAIHYLRDTFSGYPIWITENGTYPEITGGQDRFLVEHLQWMFRAIERDEIDIRGYFWWSLMDNYEWNHGMDLRFGLYEVKPDDPMKKRIKRPIADTLSRIAKDREIPQEFKDKYPIPE